MAGGFDERMSHTFGHGNIGQAGKFHDFEGVGGYLSDTLVAPHGGDAQYIQMFGRQQNGQGIVVSGITIDNDFSHDILPWAMVVKPCASASTSASS